MGIRRSLGGIHLVGVMNFKPTKRYQKYIMRIPIRNFFDWKNYRRKKDDCLIRGCDKNIFIEILLK